MAREVTVVGAAGGVGASTLAALLAHRRAADGARVALVDLDPGRGGIEVLLGIEAQAGARWSDLAQVRGTLAGGDLDGLLPRWHGVDVLSTDRHDTTVDGEALAAVWAGLLASGRTVVADLPRGALVTGASGAHPALAGDVLLLTGQDVLGVAGAVVVRGALGGGARLVLRRRPHARVAPSEAVRLLDLPLAGMLPGDRRVAEATDRGFGPAVTGWSALGRSVRRLARALDHG
jgi:hypothetical protein